MNTPENMEELIRKEARSRTRLNVSFKADTPVYTDVPDDTTFWTQQSMNKLIVWAVTELNASDVRLTMDFPPLIKVNGKWRPACDRKITGPDVDNLVPEIMRDTVASSSIKSGIPADFRYEIAIGRDKYLRFRGNITAHTLTGGQVGMDVVFRSIPTMVPTVESVSMDKEEILQNIFPDRGLVLISGPMGSGKTTTLAALMRIIRTKYRHKAVATYENPIEFDYAQIDSWGPLTQCELPFNLKDFRDVARNMARRSVEVVLVGESRDESTFQALLGAANMGIALYTTLHANSVADSFARIINEFPHERQMTVMGTLVSSSRFLMHQRLVPGSDGKRLPLREYLSFDESIRMELASCSTINQLLVKTHMFVKEQGHSLLADAEDLYENGKITEEVFKNIEREYKDIEKANTTISNVEEKPKKSLRM